MTEHQIADRAKRHGLRIFKLKPIVQDTYLLINTEQKKIAGKFPMTLHNGFICRLTQRRENNVQNL